MRPTLRHMTAIKRTLDHDEAGYKLSCEGLTRGEVLELLIAMRRLELYRLMEVETDIVEKAARTMGEYDVTRSTKT